MQKQPSMFVCAASLTGILAGALGCAEKGVVNLYDVASVLPEARVNEPKYDVSWIPFEADGKEEYRIYGAGGAFVFEDVRISIITVENPGGPGLVHYNVFIVEEGEENESRLRDRVFSLSFETDWKERYIAGGDMEEICSVGDVRTDLPECSPQTRAAVERNVEALINRLYAEKNK